jgi:hypothetical protein
VVLLVDRSLPAVVLALNLAVPSTSKDKVK